MPLDVYSVVNRKRAPVRPSRVRLKFLPFAFQLVVRAQMYLPFALAYNHLPRAGPWPLKLLSATLRGG